jgi:hypothetical protein
MESSRGYHWFFEGESARLLGRAIAVVAAAVLVPTMAQAAPPRVEVGTVAAVVKPKPVVSAPDAVSAAVSARAQGARVEVEELRDEFSGSSQSRV